MRMILCVAVVIYTAAFWVVLDRPPEDLMGLRARLCRVARWILFLVAAFMFAYSVVLISEVGVLQRDGVLQDKPAEFLFDHVVGLGAMSVLAWCMIIGVMLRPDVQWLFRRLAARLRRPSE